MRDSYRIGRDPGWSSMQLNYDGVKLIAFTNALVQNIATSEDIPLSIEDINANSLFQMLHQEKVGAVFSSLPKNIITKADYAFSDPILFFGPVLVVRENSPVSSLEELKEKIVAVNQFSDSVLIVQKNPSIIIKPYTDMMQALEDLISGKIDGALVAFLDAKALIPTRFEGRLKIVSKPLDNKALRLIVLKNKNRQLLDHFNHGLKLLKQSGRYKALLEEYSLT